ncbi:MAG: methylmalonyl-CoA mutase family protein, partial [Rhodobacteraceae bacterium]|nr:methylmalonyl-CoA mutase family protein [Paracoccaceae bacterium]
ARARAVQLPAWNEALGLPRPWDQQWSLRMQQIMAYETDLLEYEDLFDGNPAVERKVEALKAEARAEIAQIDKMGGAVAAIEYMKTSLVQANAARLGRIESGDTMVVGVNRFEAGEPSPLTGGDKEIMVVDPEVEQQQIEALNAWRAARDTTAVETTLKALRAAAKAGKNIMPPSIACAKAGVTTGEWGAAMRDIFGEYRAPTGVSMAMANDTSGLEDIQAEVRKAAANLGAPLRFLVGKPGLDGHSNGAEQIAVRARDSGMMVFYEGIRMTPEALVETARRERVHIIGLSILSGSHLPLVRETMARLKALGLKTPVIVGGIIPDDDAVKLTAIGVARVYTPKDFDLNQIMQDVISLTQKHT